MQSLVFVRARVEEIAACVTQTSASILSRPSSQEQPPLLFRHPSGRGVTDNRILEWRGWEQHAAPCGVVTGEPGQRRKSWASWRANDEEDTFPSPSPLPPGPLPDSLQPSILDAPWLLLAKGFALRANVFSLPRKQSHVKRDSGMLDGMNGGFSSTGHIVRGSFQKRNSSIMVQIMP